MQYIQNQLTIKLQTISKHNPILYLSSAPRNEWMLISLYECRD